VWPFLVTTLTQSIHNDFVALKGEKNSHFLQTLFSSSVILTQYQLDEEKKSASRKWLFFFSIQSVSGVTIFSYSTHWFCCFYMETIVFRVSSLCHSAPASAFDEDKKAFWHGHLFGPFDGDPEDPVTAFSGQSNFEFDSFVSYWQWIAGVHIVPAVKNGFPAGDGIKRFFAVNDEDY
jgi:hypothetical protein